MVFISSNIGHWGLKIMDKLETYASLTSKDAFFRNIATSGFLDGIGLYHPLWNRYIKNNFPVIPADANKLRLVLGVGRSGTTWISNALAKTETPTVFLEEPIYHVYPPVCLANKKEHTASPYIFKGGNSAERLLTTYRLLSDLNSRAYRDLLSKRSFPIKRDDADAEVVLIKEVHALLASEYLVSKLDCRAILISRHYITVVDSILNFSGIRDPLFWMEFNHIADKKYLSRYFEGDAAAIENIHKTILNISNFRLKAIAVKALVVLLIQKMFTIIAASHDNVMLISYEEIMVDRDAMFEKMSGHLQIEYSKGNYLFDEKNPTHEMKENNIARPDREVFYRKNKFLTQVEIAYVEELLAGLCR
jgi:hypothetical protein